MEHVVDLHVDLPLESLESLEVTGRRVYQCLSMFIMLKKPQKKKMLIFYVLFDHVHSSTRPDAGPGG